MRKAMVSLFEEKKREGKPKKTIYPKITIHLFSIVASGAGDDGKLLQS